VEDGWKIDTLRKIGGRCMKYGWKMHERWVENKSMVEMGGN
jgi:hypothetical protein